MKRPQSFLEEALCSPFVSCFTEIKINRISFGIDCTIQIHPLTFYFDICFVNSPGVICWLKMTSYSFI